MSPLAQRLRRQAVACREMGSPLTAALLHGAADDLVAGGVVAELLAPYAEEPGGSAVPLRLAGALHRLVLEGAAPELAPYYASAGGAAAADGAWAAAERVCRSRLPRLRRLVALPLQTNEVGRSTVLLGALLRLAERHQLPLRLLEVGASAGLNLRFDAYAHEVADGVVLGDASSPVRLHRPWRGAHPPYDASLRVVERRGCDPHPLDPTTDEDRLRLTSYVWGDQVERLDRLRAAVGVAARVPAEVVRAGAAEFLRAELARRREGVLTVIWHSVVVQYMEPRERAEVDALLAAAGGEAREPLVRLALEPERAAAGFSLRATTWPGSTRGAGPLAEHWADCLGHGPPVSWR